MAAVTVSVMSLCFCSFQVLSSLGYHVVTFDYRGMWAPVTI